jgi:hypothetical protein
MSDKRVRDRATQEWIAEGGRLTKDLAQAVSFSSLAQAVRFCRERRLCGMELVMPSEHGRENTIPLDEAFCLDVERQE